MKEISAGHFFGRIQGKKEHSPLSGQIELTYNLIREPKFNLLKVDIEYARNKLLPLVRNRKFITDSKCAGCNLIDSCRRCPGRVFLGTGDMEVPVEYYCQLAKALANGH